MTLYPIDDKTKTVLTQDLFRMLGLGSLSEEEKEKFIDSVTLTATTYFFQEKLPDNLTTDQMKDFVAKYPEPNMDNAEAMFEYLVKVLPNASDLFVEAFTEVKAKIVKEHYTLKLSKLEEELNTTADEARKTELENLIEVAKKNLEHAINGEYEQIN